ncbi:hypothetical protein [Bacillus albus]|uniref:hypothetical protein n=1 Tax=Bacillus albus TaxID=2026189 RepID=UPI0025707988|nr:hypothetical protein [Bacillus albus]WJE68318.1 hypothetical protein QRY64_00540 [Bacillus albus]
MEFLQQLLQDATKLFVTVFITTFATAYANRLVAKRNNKVKEPPRRLPNVRKVVQRKIIKLCNLPPNGSSYKLDGMLPASRLLLLCT